MITKQQLIEKCKGLYFKPVDETEWNLCVDKCREVGITAFLSFEKQGMTLFKITKYGSFFRPLSTVVDAVPATEFLSYFSNVDEWVEEEKMKIEEKDSGYTMQLKERTESKTEKLSRKNYLLNRVKQIEDNKKECIARMDSEVESLQKEMTSANCYVMEFAEINKYKESCHRGHASEISRNNFQEFKKFVESKIKEKQ